jgi:hypothetical protein
MRRRIAHALLASTLALGGPVLAQTRLTDQSVLGWKRLCSYEDLRPAPPGVRSPRNYVMEVGRGEPCPPRYSPPAAQRPTRPAAREARPGAH